MHVIARPNHPPVISLPREFQHLLLFVLGWREVNWELHVGWRLRPTFKAFWTSEGPKCPQNGLKMGLFHPFVHPKWSRMRSGKMRF